MVGILDRQGSYVGDSFGGFLYYFVKEKEIQLIIFEQVLKGNMKMENLENRNLLLSVKENFILTLFSAYFCSYLAVFLLAWQNS